MRTMLLEQNKDRYLVAVINDEEQITKYVVCSGYDPTRKYGDQWYNGTYFMVDPLIKNSLKGAIKNLYHEGNSIPEYKSLDETINALSGAINYLTKDNEREAELIHDVIVDLRWDYDN